MRTVSAMDLRKRLGEMLDAASAGERILIERDHRPLAYLISVEDAQRLDPDREELLARQTAAFERLRAHAEEMRGKEYQPDDGLTDTEWMHQERERRAEQIDRAASSRWDDE
jgi:prevent-host-death family protein